MQVLINLYETFSEALHTAQELEAAQIPSGNISLMGLNGQSSDSPDTASFKSKSSSKLELHHLPGLEPVAAYGWLVTSALEHTPEQDRGINSAPPTGLMTCLTNHGVDSKQAHAFIEGLKHGSALIGVLIPSNLVETASRIMREDHSPLDPYLRGKHYETGRFNPEDFARVKRSERALAMLIAGSSKT